MAFSSIHEMVRWGAAHHSKPPPGYPCGGHPNGYGP
ncbi:hypothetical protein FOWG_16972 [Fusarium oxysporum f. sp. lycopersici MN25]|nr:hypothetical protein FOWG_16972 [Fusarium oxysporum f. sp. lycopersici MN25]